MEVVCNTLRDCVVCRVTNTNIILAAVYIPPSNSEYFDEIYMKNLELLCNGFKSSHLLIAGDCNARTGTISYTDSTIKHLINPDTTNHNGRELKRFIAANEDMVVLNGYSHPLGTFDSKFTYYRGTLKSQNDVALSNKIDNITSFKIMAKTVHSDHCPVLITCNATQEIPLYNHEMCTRYSQPRSL